MPPTMSALPGSNTHPNKARGTPNQDLNKLCIWNELDTERIPGCGWLQHTFAWVQLARRAGLALRICSEAQKFGGDTEGELGFA
jgi:hypothetical protein